MGETNPTLPTITVEQLTSTLMDYVDQLSSLSDQHIIALLHVFQGHLLSKYRVVPVAATDEGAGPSPE